MKTLRTKCSACSAALSTTNASLAGKTIRCPKCASVVRLPDPDKDVVDAADLVGKLIWDDDNQTEPVKKAKATSSSEPQGNGSKGRERLQENRKRRKAKRSSGQSNYILIGGAAVILIGALAVVGYFAISRSQSSTTQNDSVLVPEPKSVADTTGASNTSSPQNSRSIGQSNKDTTGTETQPPEEPFTLVQLPEGTFKEYRSADGKSVRKIRHYTPAELAKQAELDAKSEGPPIVVVPPSAKVLSPRASFKFDGFLNSAIPSILANLFMTANGAQAVVSIQGAAAPNSKYTIETNSYGLDTAASGLILYSESTSIQALSSDGTKCIRRSSVGYEIAEPRSGKLIAKLPNPGLTTFLSPERILGIITGQPSSIAPKIEIFDANTGKSLHRANLPNGVGRFISSPVRSGTELLFLNETLNTVGAWNISEQKIAKEVALPKLLPGERPLLYRFMASASGERFLLQRTGNSMEVFDWDSGAPVWKFKWATEYFRSMVRLHPSGKYLVMSCDLTKSGRTARENSIVVFDLAQDRIVASLVGHKGVIQGIVISENGEMAVSTDSLGVLLTWDLRQLQK